MDDASIELADDESEISEISSTVPEDISLNTYLIEDDQDIADTDENTQGAEHTETSSTVPRDISNQEELLRDNNNVQGTGESGDLTDISSFVPPDVSFQTHLIEDNGNDEDQTLQQVDQEMEEDENLEVNSAHQEMQE